MKLSLSLGACAALSCAAPPPPPAPLAPERSSPPAVTVSAAPTASATPAPLPIDPGADPDKLALVRSICPAAIKHQEGRVLVGCRACPPFVAESAKPDGKVEVDPADFWPVEALYRGSFSKPGAHEVASVFKGCEPHAGSYGGMLFAEQTGAGFRATTYVSGLRPERCEVYHRKDGRDLLVCQTGEAWQSTHSTSVFVYDLARAAADDPWKGKSELALVTENGFAVCWALSHGDGIVQGSVRRFRFEDRNHDGVPDVVVDVVHRMTPYSPRIERVIQRACADAATRAGTPDEMPSIFDPSALLGAPVKETLEFLFDGQDFRPTAKTAASLKRLAPFL